MLRTKMYVQDQKDSPVNATSMQVPFDRIKELLFLQEKKWRNERFCLLPYGLAAWAHSRVSRAHMTRMSVEGRILRDMLETT
jgi:hypothetical protein